MAQIGDAEDEEVCQSNEQAKHRYNYTRGSVKFILYKNLGEYKEAEVK
jgi:hypothetical protein